MSTHVAAETVSHTVQTGLVRARTGDEISGDNPDLRTDRSCIGGGLGIPELLRAALPAHDHDVVVTLCRLF